LRNSVLCLVLGVGLLAGTSIAHGQTPMPTLVAQAPVTVPPSGVLVTQPPAPVAVPPSGVLVTPPTADRRAVVDVLRRLSDLSQQPLIVRDVSEIEINPLAATENGALALDALIVLHS